ncbi:MAG: endonuclease/exonuclease/phosphatase family protein [Brachybacterium sp.]|uniref:endonuclease/exonuclease/phosphatase family protein n=1 Tax=Brachybacterium sp. TaxID=1891286 RepID=UPI00264A2358|nr:endonuclease/exonuclease/phosphatase family protein [Brachybacterium sp.]MDN5687283.1 endonuclease/exonuclease/phosphatase family protein [Brachybacterium sp.]
MSALRVATVNIHHGADGRDRRDLTRAAAALAALDADVIGVQEVDVGFGPRSGDEDQAARLAELLGYQGCFGATIDRPAPADGVPARYGLALLTRGQILRREMQLLPGDPRRPSAREPRGLLSVRLRSPQGAELTVLVTHLDPAHRHHRAAQVRGICEAAATLPGPRVLLGDLNTDPAAGELAALAAGGWREAAAELVGPLARRPGLRRLVAALPGGPLRATFPARLPLRRLDSVWVHDGIRVETLEVGAGRASDHRPVVAGIRLPQGSSIVGP